MNKFFDLLDKYKFGLLAAILVYVGIYSYLVIDTYDTYGDPYKAFFDGPKLEVPEELIEELELQPENIDVANFSNDPAKNAVRDMNDKREQSDKDWSQNQSMSKNEPLDIKELEEQMRNSTGESDKRAEIQKKIDKLKKEKEDYNKSKNTGPDNVKGGDKAPKGNVMVSFDLSNRTAYENNLYYVRNPGYTCQQGSAGKVIIKIKVNQNGDVVSANIESAGGANPCMQEQALKYAKISRFNFSGSAPSSQEGLIYYTFVAG